MSVQKRRVKTLLRFFHEVGKARSTRLKFVCTDMWGAFPATGTEPSNPIQALQEWQKKTNLFVKDAYNLTGLDALSLSYDTIMRLLFDLKATSH